MIRVVLSLFVCAPLPFACLCMGVKWAANTLHANVVLLRLYVMFTYASCCLGWRVVRGLRSNGEVVMLLASLLGGASSMAALSCCSMSGILSRVAIDAAFGCLLLASWMSVRYGRGVREASKGWGKWFRRTMVLEHIPHAVTSIYTRLPALCDMSVAASHLHQSFNTLATLPTPDFEKVVLKSGSVCVGAALHMEKDFQAGVLSQYGQSTRSTPTGRSTHTEPAILRRL